MQFIEDLKIMPISWWVTFATNSGFAILNAVLGWTYANPFCWFVSGFSVCIALTHLTVWSIFFAPAQREIDFRREELKRIFEEKGLTWPH